MAKIKLRKGGTLHVLGTTYAKRISALFLMTLTLYGCSSNPEDKVADFLEKGDIDVAIEWLADHLEKMPEDPLLNGLMAEVQLKKCFKINCFESDDSPIMPAIDKHLAFVKGVVVQEDIRRDVYGNILKLTQPALNLEAHPRPLIRITQAIPADIPAKNRFTGLLFTTAASHLKARELPQANILLSAVEDMAADNDPQKHAAAFFKAMIGQDTSAANASLTSLRELPEEKQILSPEAVSTIPYVLYITTTDRNQANGTEEFLTHFRKMIYDMNLPVFSHDGTRAHLAKALRTMAHDPQLIEDALAHYRPTRGTPPAQAEALQKDETGAFESAAVTGAAPIVEEGDTSTNVKEELFLRFLNAAILVHPQSPELWDEFFAPAMAYVAKTGDANMLFDELSPKDIPQSIIPPYNKQLFALIEDGIQQNRDILPFIEKIIVPTVDPGPVKHQAAELLKKALDKAIDSSNYALIYTYASFRPEIARSTRQKVVNIIINALEKKWQNDEYADLSQLASFLSDTMEIDFSLDSLLLQNFEEGLKKEGVLAKLNAETIDPLLAPKEQATVDLGKKFAYLKERFKDEPKALDNALKNLIVSAEGLYGTPNALYRLFGAFNNEEFPEAERQTYLVNAIKNAIVKDEKLSAYDLSQKAPALHKAHPDVSYVFLVGETLKRMQGLEEARKIWKNATEDFREGMKSARPQFVALMEAINAYEGGDKQKAADLFTLLTDRDYVEYAKPYLKGYVESIHAYKGTYLADNTDKTNRALIITVDPSGTGSAGENTAGQEENGNILGVNLGMTNAIGAVAVQSPKDLTEDYGKIYRYLAEAKVNPNTMNIALNNGYRAGARLPLAFEKIYGDLRTLTFKDGKITVFIGDEKTPYTFTRISEESDAPLYPNGRYGIVKQISNADEKTSHVLPVGSIITLKTQSSKALRPVQNGRQSAPIYPVKGTIMHPASAEPRPLEGFFNPQLHTVSFSYSYPLGGGGTLDAALKCQVLATTMLCGGHNKHWSRLRHSHLVEGKKAEAKSTSKEGEYNKVLEPPRIQ